MKFEKIEALTLAFTAALSILLCGATVMSIVVLAGLLSGFAVVPLHGQTRPAVELEAAMTKERVDGDLKTAVAAYQKIAADKSAPRDVRAKALLHLAGCYEKLGQQAQSVYQQIVRDFADQPAAVQARARLAALKQDNRPAAPTTMTQRKIEMPGGMGPGDTDGHHAVYLNRATGELFYGDLAGKSKRVIFKSNHPLGFWPSRDFSIVGLQLSDQPATLAVVNTDGTGYREIARLDGSVGCSNWSWDNRYLLLCADSKKGSTRLLRISVADGQIRELLSLKAGIVMATFSPNGRFAAYAAPASQADPVSRIFVLPTEGGEPQLVYEERRTAGFSRYLQSLRLLDWTADGRYLAIASERTGTGALHLLPIKDGKPAGPPVFVRYGDFEEGVTTAAGGLVYSSVRSGMWAVYLASLDANSRPGDWKRLDLQVGHNRNPPFPIWSDDGNQIVYVATNEDIQQTGGQVVHLHNLSTGEDREIYHALGIVTCVWASQQPKLYCVDSATERTDIVSIAVDSGEIARLQAFTPSRLLFMNSPSRVGRALYLFHLLKDGDTGKELLRWEIATQRETILGQFPSTAAMGVLPNERGLARWADQAIDVRPMSGGDWRPLVSRAFLVIGASPDGNWVFYGGVDSTGKHGLFRVATAGGEPERLGDLPTNSPNGSLEISPDGSKIMFSCSGTDTSSFTETELWSLENFVPPAPKP